ncbi:MAG: HEAT repeat domain-containing protein [Thiofilum sp.]|uniref:HEAT repeat domain-containing protein n=1 Tax=Thiofilum sp. TaxID=2212733 RepID=UPI0025F80774|nr:HEAT repeat domain-containing protein [Thiofilum sp.]MBK8451817.1 HEAT repeat domain-containing protein [Thiofilum sp.]
MTLPIYQQWLINEHNLSSYYNSLLLSGEASRVSELILKNPSSFKALMELLTTKGKPLSTRMGIGVVMEDLAGTQVLKDYVRLLISLTQDEDARLRADACYYLELSAHPAALESVKACLEDRDPSVREVAADAVATLSQLLNAQPATVQ